MVHHLAFPGAVCLGKTKVLCKYHMSGVCRFGADCAFSHDLTDLPNLVCKYYLAGCCAYGNRCRSLLDTNAVGTDGEGGGAGASGGTSSRRSGIGVTVHDSWEDAAAALAEEAPPGLLQEQELAAAAATGTRPPVLQGGSSGGGGGGHSRWAAAQHPWELAATPGGGGISGRGTAAAVDPVDPADVDLCPGFSLHGRCAQGEDCELIHGLQCEICHKFRINPYNPEAAEEHRSTCRLRHERLEARLRSASVECGICLELVLSKPSVSERRFGLLTSCDHAFCLACIRSWRGRTDDATLATDTAVRTCPICRTPSHFVTPSLVWPASSEEKAGIVSAYKDRLASIDCKHFNFGEGSCPFSTSCFYRHMYKDGRLEEPVLRRAGNADGDIRVVMPLRLSAFLDTPQALRLLSRRRYPKEVEEAEDTP
ncbi:hypothetical protein VOLCADRAFT_102729 [Volvox carteri f. nagariensis]|uniref:RING-type E3 ubiquitin transferase n=1 Tax=Volvox carteri f. nagariensis TaxID=3068 RepID=D8THQ1_VOLCA|nr:uncharacterized protein VOLCADRAFT_102729 [Volvox carteri f. nagariensis]EFJ52753.1 hypothetical protein VOLCADRAFT_102729 [Volvox carteri f. nagariensis]|eukprot:XP_002945758.1 hypothetical protein VOLCADRAFT_102729 [Volvox carteri f. nagariensis]